MEILKKSLVVAFVAVAFAGCSANGGFPGGGGGGGGGISAADLDGDGVLNADDLCPNTQAGAAVDADGCSEGQTPVNAPILIDLGELGGIISEIADYQCTNFPNGVGAEVTEGLACSLGIGLCQTMNPEQAVDGIGDGSTYATVNLVTSLLVLPGSPLGSLIAGAGVIASDFGTVPAGRVAGYFVEFPTDVADANVIQTLTVTTFVDGVEQESFDGLQPLGLGLLGAQLIGGAPMLVGFVNTLPYNELQIVIGGTVEAEALQPTIPPASGIDAVTGEVAKVWGACTNAVLPE